LKRVLRVILVRLVSFSIVVCFHAASVFAAITIGVASYGEKCNGVTDDRSAIQNALKAAYAAGGGTVTLPDSTCLLNSFAASSHPWIFYNLHIPSSVTLQGTAGSKLLQGPNGRQLIGNIPGASYIENTVVAVGNDFASIHFQNVGVFYNLNSSTVGSPLLPSLRPLRQLISQSATTSRCTSTRMVTYYPPR